MKPNSTEHAEARVGKITSSVIDTILYGTHIGLENLSKQLRKTEPDELGSAKSEATEWGVANEPAARAMFISANPELNIGRKAFVTYQGAIERFRRYCGVSPDLVVFDGEDRIIDGAEIKCPFLPENHMVNRMTMAVPANYFPQVQYMMFVTGAPQWRFVSYDPRICNGNPTDNPGYSEILVKPDQVFVSRIISRLHFFIDHHEAGGDFKVKADPLEKLLNFF